jgi:hypothetical protein
MIEYGLRALCLTNGRLSRKELDRAVKFCGGRKEVTLDEPSDWDVWYVPEDKECYIPMFLSHPQDVIRFWPK